MSETLSYLAAHLAAFWVAIGCFSRARGSQRHASRFTTGLAAGAVLAHMGGHALRSAPLLSLGADAGPSVLFAPLGMLIVTPWTNEERVRFLAPALSSLPLALATARLGCVVLGCCLGIEWDLPGIGRVHPAPAIEIAALVALHLALRRQRTNLVPASFFLAFAAIRVGTQAFRPPDEATNAALLVSVMGGWWGLGLLSYWLAAPSIGQFWRPIRQLRRLFVCRNA